MSLGHAHANLPPRRGSQTSETTNPTTLLPSPSGFGAPATLGQLGHGILLHPSPGTWRPQWSVKPWWKTRTPLSLEPLASSGGSKVNVCRSTPLRCSTCMHGGLAVSKSHGRKGAVDGSGRDTRLAATLVAIPVACVPVPVLYSRARPEDTPRHLGSNLGGGGGPFLQGSI